MARCDGLCRASPAVGRSRPLDRLECGTAASLTAHGSEHEPFFDPASRPLHQPRLHAAGDGGTADACRLRATISLPADSRGKFLWTAPILRAPVIRPPTGYGLAA